MAWGPSGPHAFKEVIVSAMDLVIGYALALITAIVVLSLPRREPLPEGASVGLLVLMFVVWVAYTLAALLW